MLFNSLQFLIFFPIVTSVYFFLPYKSRWMWLLAASCYFYMSWRPAYILLIAFSTVIDYFVALQIGKTPSKSKCKKYLLISLLSNLGTLFIFKYFNFFNGSLGKAFGYFHVAYPISGVDLLLPVGISFYTFQALSYTIDAYRRDI